MYFCVHLNLGKIISFIEIKIHHKFSNMFMHSCCCILFLYYVVWNQISNWFEFAFKSCLEICLENRKEFPSPSFAFGLLVCSSAPAQLRLRGPSFLRATCFSHPVAYFFAKPSWQPSTSSSFPSPAWACSAAVQANRAEARVPRWHPVPTFMPR